MESDWVTLGRGVEVNLKDLDLTDKQTTEEIRSYHSLQHQTRYIEIKATTFNLILRFNLKEKYFCPYFSHKSVQIYSFRKKERGTQRARIDITNIPEVKSGIGCFGWRNK